ncbi:MAG: response regulator [bacterium]|nr:response regulator [bacterium]
MERPEDKTILVVEDEPDVRIFLQTVLEDAGFNVLTAADGEEALKIIGEHRPDFISLDLVLPRKSGYKLLLTLKRDQELARIPVLIVTAHARTDLGKPQMEEIFEKTALLGPGLYLEKPVKPRQYIRCVKQALGLSFSESDEDDADIKNEIQTLLNDANSESLARALAALKKKSN